MNKFLMPFVFAAGLLLVAWVGWGFVGTSPLALLMTGVIAAVYSVGAREVWRMHQHTASLRQALQHTQGNVPNLEAWLAPLPHALQQPLRQRIAGERVALPGLALAPYLVGLLVMLGMLGTFLGMVVTFKGALFALEGSSNLEAIRSALAAPIRGLSLSFGTSVAGVAASAALGLLAALARRERAAVTRLLDALVQTHLRAFSAHQQRDELLQTLHTQAQALPAVVQQLAALAQGLEQRQHQLGQTLSQGLLAQQEAFHQGAAQTYSHLARDVAATLQTHLVASATALEDSVRPVVEHAMGQLTQQAQASHQQTSQALLGQTQTTVQATVQQLAGQWQQVADASAQAWEATSQRQAQHQASLVTGLAETLAAFNQRFEDRLTQLLQQTDGLTQARVQAEQQWMAQQQERMAHMTRLWQTELGSLREQEVQQAQAVADVVAQLHQAQHNLNERDNAVLADRSALLARLEQVLESVHHHTQAQQTAVAQLAQQGAHTLEQASQRVADALAQQVDQAQAISAHLTASAVELGGAGDVMGQGLRAFSASNEQLAQSLQRVEQAIAQSQARSDDQLAYYVAQAREVIDLSISAQQSLVEDLRLLRSAPAPKLAEKTISKSPEKKPTPSVEPGPVQPAAPFPDAQLQEAEA